MLFRSYLNIKKTIGFFVAETGYDAVFFDNNGTEILRTQFYGQIYSSPIAYMRSIPKFGGKVIDGRLTIPNIT